VSEPAPSSRQVPALEPDTAFYWTAGGRGRLEVCTCVDCGWRIHPPLPRCPKCSGETAPQAVSGKGRVASYTVNHQAWVPGLSVPYVYAAIELAEQPGLYVFSNVVGCPVEAVRKGLPVEVTFEAHDEVYIPLFRPVGGADAG
jgi:uncharacterized OB-fold protein